MKPQQVDTIGANSKASMLKDSHRISKLKPKIRIIHIVAPKIIKTDVENFRDLVQRLTGKPAKGLKGIRMATQGLSTNGPKLWANVQQQDHQQMNQDMCKVESSHGLFGGFGDMGNFIQDFTEYPLLPFKSSQINMFGEIDLC